MRTHDQHVVLAAATIAVVLACGLATANAQGIPGVDPNKCLAGKTKCVNKKIAGLLKCREKCQKSPDKCGTAQDDCENKVIAKFDGGVKLGCFEKLEAKDDGVTPDRVCTTTGDQAAMKAKADGLVGEFVAILESNPPPNCGNGVAQGFESCDGADLRGATCESLGFTSGTLACTAGCGFDLGGCTGTRSLATGQTTCWDSAGSVIPCAGTGHDGEIRAGAVLAYQDHGNGTITDLNTGLMWEKKGDDGSINDKDTTYTWDNAFAVHVAALNAGTGFAGHKDWRVPNVKELQSIVNYEIPWPGPAVSSAFNNNCTPGCTVLTCSCTALFHWSSTTYANRPFEAWYVGFGNGIVLLSYKSDGLDVRAVRGGS